MDLNLPNMDDMNRLYKQLLEDLVKLFSEHVQTPKLLTGREVAKMLRQSPGKLKRMRDNGEIQYIKTGKKYLYELKHILEIIERNKRNKGLMCVLYCLASPYLDMDVLCA